MTVPHADPSARTVRLLLAIAVVGAIAGPVLFFALYMVAVDRGVPGGRRAATVGLSVEVLVWSAVLFWLATRSRLRPALLRWRAMLTLTAVAPYTALSWMVFDLLYHREPLGVWASIPTVALAPGAALLAIAVPRLESPEPLAEEEEDVEPDLAVGVDAGFWHELTSTLSPGDEEQGGVALTTVRNGTLVVVGVVLPQQVSASSVRCEFAVTEVERVRDALDTLDPDSQDQLRMTWLHTHPGLGVFLSGTDVATSANWRGLDPDFRPIVVDVGGTELADQIGVFGPDNRKIQPIGLVEDVIEPAVARAVRRAILDRYRRERMPEPQVLIGPAAVPSRGR